MFGRLFNSKRMMTSSDGERRRCGQGPCLGFTLLDASNEGQQRLAALFPALSFTRDFFERKQKGKESTYTLHEMFVCFCFVLFCLRKTPRRFFAYASPLMAKLLLYTNADRSQIVSVGSRTDSLRSPQGAALGTESRSLPSWARPPEGAPSKNQIFRNRDATEEKPREKQFYIEQTVSFLPHGAS